MIGLILIYLLINNLRVKIEFKKVHIYNINKIIKIDYIINIYVCLLNKFMLFKVPLKKRKINIFKKQQNDSENKFNNILKIIKNKGYTIENLKINGRYSTIDTIISQKIYIFLHSIIPILIAPNLSGMYINNLEVLNINENSIDINIFCIINTKFVNIINIFKFIEKEKGGEKENGKSSN